MYDSFSLQGRRAVVYTHPPMGSDHRRPPVIQAAQLQPTSLPTMALLLATMAWGGSFTWAKAAGDAVNQAVGLPSGSLLGPILLLAWRFTAAGVLWLVLFPAARRGWSWPSLGRSVLLGVLLWAGQTVQMLGLDRTSEAVNAFLTSLTVVFVPLLMMAVVRRPPGAAIWLPVGLAALGIWLMTGATPTGFGAGEMLGLACAVFFSAHMIALGEVGRRDSPWQIGAGQFLSVGLGSAAMCLFVSHGNASVTLQAQWAIIAGSQLWLHVALLTVVSTMAAFGLMFYFQPKLDPTRAALIYLAEPIFAALYAYAAVGRDLSAGALLGASLILTANALVELMEWHQKRRSRRARLRSSVSPTSTATALNLEAEPSSACERGL
jgi:drug/metabolite transporter (DMT)-like permease